MNFTVKSPKLATKPKYIIEYMAKEIKELEIVWYLQAAAEQ